MLHIFKIGLGFILPSSSLFYVAKLESCDLACLTFEWFYVPFYSYSFKNILLKKKNSSILLIFFFATCVHHVAKHRAGLRGLDQTCCVHCSLRAGQSAESSLLSSFPGCRTALLRWCV